MQNKLGIGCQCSLHLRSTDTLFDPVDKTVIRLCNSLVHNWRGLRFPPGAHRALYLIDRWGLSSNGWSVIVTGRRRRRCRALFRGAGWRLHRASAGWIEIFPAARATDVTI